MVQLELPLAFKPVVQVANPQNYRLPQLWKAVFVLLLIYSLALSSVIFINPPETQAETAGAFEDNAANTPETLDLPIATGQVKMTATVPGWYEIERLDNENLLIKSNMQVWVNGREFIRCDGCDQGKLDPSLLDF